MENQPAPSKPVQPVQPPQPVPPAETPVSPPKPAFPWKIILFLIIVIIVVSVGVTFFLVKSASIAPLSQTKPAPTIVVGPLPTTVITEITKTASPSTTISISPANTTVSPTIASSCDVSDNSFCTVLAALKSALTMDTFNGFLTYQNLLSVTCDPDGMFVAICEGAAKGTVKQGYGIGYNQSEGTTVDKNDYATTVFGYVNSNGPFTYRGSLVSGDKGVAVFLNANKDHLMVFPLKRTGNTWKMNTLLIGGTFNDNSFDNLSNSLLDFVQ